MKAVVVPMRKPDDPRTRLRVHEEITAAKDALTEARGRLVEARTREQFEEVLGWLRRANEHVDRAASQCVSVVAQPDTKVGSDTPPPPKRVDRGRG